MTVPSEPTLPQRMRAAAQVLSEATARLEPCNSRGWLLSPPAWSSDSLNRLADRWEAEDRASAERDALVEELAREIHAADDAERPWVGAPENNPTYARIARRLVESGWRKGDPA